MLDQIRQKSKEKREYLTDTNSLTENQLKILNLIDDLLSDDLCFLKLDVTMAVVILVYIGYPKEQAKQMYPDLVQAARQKAKGKYILFDPQCLSQDADSSTE